MRSTFMGLEASKKGLFVQQSALYTTGHNISNANTDGYTRQRVNMQATPGFPYPGLNSPTYPGHLGTGVEAHSIQRMRDEFTDRQFRQETNKLGYWDSTLKSINQMEDILNEPSDFGIDKAFTEFWEGFQDLSTQPTDSAARKVAIARAESLAEAFNYNYTQIETIQGNLGNEISVSTKQINTILDKIALINSQVQALEPNGYVTNDLYDARDLLVDELNEFLPITIERVPSGGNASPVAEGSLKITYQGKVLVEGKYAGSISVNDSNDAPIDGAIDGDTYAPFTSLALTPAAVPGRTGAEYEAPQDGLNYADLNGNHNSRGKLLALIDAYGYVQVDANGNPVQDANGNDVVKGIYPEMLADLNKLAETFVAIFNEAHAQGYTLATDATPSQKGVQFFETTTNPAAKNMKVRDEITKDPNLVAASTREGEEGNGRWAMELSDLQYKPLTEPLTLYGGNTINNVPIPDGLKGFTFQNFYTGLIGDLAVKGDMAITNQFNATTQMITISNARASHNSVSLDEEMTNMITFQQAYNANARMITVVDETLDKIINGMGRVGL